MIPNPMSTENTEKATRMKISTIVKQNTAEFERVGWNEAVTYIYMYTERWKVTTALHSTWEIQKKKEDVNRHRLAKKQVWFQWQLLTEKNDRCDIHVCTKKNSNTWDYCQTCMHQPSKVVAT